LLFHPHVHAIVSAGGLSSIEPESWVRARARYLFPVRVMAKLFRRLFRIALLHAIETGSVTVPSESVATLGRALFDKRWGRAGDLNQITRGGGRIRGLERPAGVADIVAVDPERRIPHALEPRAVLLALQPDSRATHSNSSKPLRCV
jgi:hypothetical protein